MISTARPGSACFTPRSSSGRPQSRSAPKLPALAMSGRSQMGNSRNQTGNSTSSAADARVRKLQGLLSQKMKKKFLGKVSSALAEREVENLIDSFFVDSRGVELTDKSIMQLERRVASRVAELKAAEQSAKPRATPQAPVPQSTRSRKDSTESAGGGRDGEDEEWLLLSLAQKYEAHEESLQRLAKVKVDAKDMRGGLVHQEGELAQRNKTDFDETMAFHNQQDRELADYHVNESRLAMERHDTAMNLLKQRGDQLSQQRAREAKEKQDFDDYESWLLRRVQKATDDDHKRQAQDKAEKMAHNKSVMAENQRALVLAAQEKQRQVRGALLLAVAPLWRRCCAAVAVMLVPLLL
jgi:hypothetical protein